MTQLFCSFFSHLFVYLTEKFIRQSFSKNKSFYFCEMHFPDEKKTYNFREQNFDDVLLGKHLILL